MNEVVRSSNRRQTKTTPAKSDHFFMRAPTLLKSGGAIRGIGKNFSTSPVTETGSVSAPIFTSPGRPGVRSQLALTDESRAGSGPLGFDWSLHCLRLRVRPGRACGVMALSTNPTYSSLAAPIAPSIALEVSKLRDGPQ